MKIMIHRLYQSIAIWLFKVYNLGVSVIFPSWFYLLVLVTFPAIQKSFLEQTCAHLIQNYPNQSSRSFHQSFVLALTQKFPALNYLNVDIDGKRGRAPHVSLIETRAKNCTKGAFFSLQSTQFRIYYPEKKETSSILRIIRHPNDQKLQRSIRVRLKWWTMNRLYKNQQITVRCNWRWWKVISMVSVIIKMTSEDQFFSLNDSPF